MVLVHGRVTAKRPQISEADVVWAWEHYTYAAIRVPGERELRIGFDLQGRELEMVGALTTDGWLVYHAMIPPSKKTRKEIQRALGRRS